MATPGRLTNPPIREALVDLRTTRSRALEPGALERLWPSIRDRFPHLEVRNKLQARFATGPGRRPDARTEDLGFHGLFLKTADESRIVQFRVDGFTFSQLKAYTTADDLFQEAIELWGRFIALAPPDGVPRVAVRYINRLALPYEHGEPFERFLNAAVVTPNGTPQVVSEFMTRTATPAIDEAGTVAIVTQHLEATRPGDETPFVLDIDVFRTGEFRLDDQELMGLLQALRVTKNQLFFAYVTDSALERYR